jgi:hypothetical protein
VYILDRKNTHFYTTKGEYLGTITNPEMLQFDKLLLNDNKLYFFKGFGLGKFLYEWVITDHEGSIIKKKRNNIESDLMVSYNINLCFKENDNLFYWNQLNDTITRIKGIMHSPRFIFAKDKNRVTYNALSSLDNFRAQQFWQSLSILGSEKYLFVEYLRQKEQKRTYAFYDVEKGEFFETYTIDSNDQSYTICNSWDNGPAIRPNVIISNNKSYSIVQWIDAYELKSHLISKVFTNSIPKYPEKKKELEKLTNSLNENDNPVLMLVKLKE